MTRSALLLVAPTRLGRVERGAARWWCAGLLLGLIAAVGLSEASARPAAELLHDSIVAAMRHGGRYYETFRDLARTAPDGEEARALPPTLAAVSAAVPSWAMLLLVGAALAGLVAVGVQRLTALFAGAAGQVLAALLLVAGTVAVALLWEQAPHAGWAALLAAYAVLLRRAERWGTAAALGCAAAVIDPAALLVPALMAAFALFDGGAREALGWLVALAVGGAVLACHLWAVAAAVPLPAEVPPLLVAPPDALARLLGAALPGVAPGIAAALMLLALLGWAALPRALGPRVVALVLAGLAADDRIAGLHSATLAAALVAPGLALVPDAVADLLRGAPGRRRITVTRVTR
ncbi:hypothetical protein K7957_00450 [Sphingomonas yunnanensis]|uniref:hypothetical protein n=1 Tax=Sphingomonas yunnanensis TaxID=310400 RepID=UPI001CA7B308|nr:hypothetical protein [Sphingomonas yunnanensis]MBY9061402.1 hypothetical protein [Sphingomonas yunnanensis]